MERYLIVIQICFDILSFVILKKLTSVFVCTCVAPTLQQLRLSNIVMLKKNVLHTAEKEAAT